MENAKRLTPVLLVMFFLVNGLLGNAAWAAAGSGGTEVTGQYFRVSYKSMLEPLPLHKIHSWTLSVESLDGRPVEKASVTVFGGMPAHHHGLPTQPRVKDLGHGSYLVEGIKFSMIGQWEMWFRIRSEGVSEDLKFDIRF